MTPILTPELLFRGHFQSIDEVGPGPFGARQVATMASGEVQGERLHGTTVGAGADWLLVAQDGFGRLDVRLTIRTHDGAHIYVQYFGLPEFNDDVVELLGGAGKSTEFGELMFLVNPRMETGDPRYSWVNQTMFIGEGRILVGPIVEYRFFRVDK